MPGKITGEEGNPECYNNLTSNETIESSPRRSKRSREIYDCIPKYISDKKTIIAAVILVILVLIIVIISLAVKSTQTCLPCHSLANQSVACPDFWIGYRGKCFYVSKEEKNWTLSLTTCSSFNASLAVIDSQKELEFWIEIFQRIHYWFGLSRENKETISGKQENSTWKWSNGTEFENQFPIRAEGFCAYVDEKGASSTICSVEKRFFCSRPENCRKPE